MAKEPFSSGRLITLAVVAVLIAFALLQFWVWSAQFPWSSDAWLLAISLAIMLMGVFAIIALVVVFSFRLWKRRK